MKEQIEDMAKIVCSAFDGNCKGCPFDFYPPCPPKAGAKRLYEAGYRKQSEKYLIKENGDILPLTHHSEWISVEDRLPENDYGKHWKERKYYLVMTEPSGLMRVARFGSKEHPWWIDSHNTVMTSANYAKVTNWMPLPEPPKNCEGNR